MAGTLFVVATPIGHLEDISARALRVLGEADLVAAEDTRRTGNLLRHFGIGTRILSLHQHNERARAAELLARLERGETVALVSDAGTPGISDPGAGMVRLAREQGHRVEAVPGPSAVATAISLAGLDDTGFAFLGFPPVRLNDRTTWFERFNRVRADLAVVFFEAPHRARRTLKDLENYVEYQILVFRELTKRHEETLSGTPGMILGALKSTQGEFTIVVPRREPTVARPAEVDPTQLATEIGHLIESGGYTKREAARLVGRKFGLSTKFVYDATR